MVYVFSRISKALLVVFGLILLSAGTADAQSCTAADVQTVNDNLDAPMAGGSDVLEIDLDTVAGTIVCAPKTGSANTAFADRVEISHRLTTEPEDLHFVSDKGSALTFVSISGPGLTGAFTPADDTPVDLSAGTYSVSMTVNGETVSFSFTITESSPNNQRIADGAIAINIADPEAPLIAAVADITTPTDAGLATASVPFATTVSDNVDPASSFTPVFTAGGATITSPHAFPVGVTTVTVTANDDTAGNTPTPITFDVTVTDPEITISSSESGAIENRGSDDHGFQPASTSNTVNYTITNEGTETLTLIGTPSVSGASNVNAPIVVSPYSSSGLLPGQSATFTITYTPTLAGPFAFDVTVNSNDHDENSFELAVVGTALGGPEINIASSESGPIADGGSDNVGTQVAGVARTITYTIENSGTDTLIIGGTPNVTAQTNIETPLTISEPTSLLLQPSDTATFTVTFAPALDGPFFFDIAVQNDDDDEAQYDIHVSGEGNANPTVVLSGPSGAQTAPFTVTATFSEPITGLERADFIIGNGAVSDLVQLSPNVYTVLITPMVAGVGTSVSLPANTVTDLDFAPNMASNVLNFESGMLTTEQLAEIRNIVIERVERDLQTQLEFNQRAVADAQDRYIAAQQCRTLEQDSNESANSANAAQCNTSLASFGETPLSFNGVFHATPDLLDLQGSFFGQTQTNSGLSTRLVFGDIEMTRYSDGDVTASLNGRIAWEQMTPNNVLLGYFIGANASKTEIDRAFSGGGGKLRSVDGRLLCQPARRESVLEWICFSRKRTKQFKPWQRGY